MERFTVTETVAVFGAGVRLALTVEQISRRRYALEIGEEIGDGLVECVATKDLQFKRGEDVTFLDAGALPKTGILALAPAESATAESVRGEVRMRHRRGVEVNEERAGRQREQASASAAHKRRNRPPAASSGKSPAGLFSSETAAGTKKDRKAETAKDKS